MLQPKARYIAMLLTFVTFVFALSTAYAGGEKGTFPIDLPTDPPHTPQQLGGPWWWWHDLVPIGGGSSLLLPAGATIGPIMFFDVREGRLWHMEFELEAGPAGNAPGIFVIAVPGMGWIRPYGALVAPGVPPPPPPPPVNFTIARPGPPAEDFDEIRWNEALVQETGVWIVTYRNFTGVDIRIDAGIAEADSTDHGYEGDETLADFTGEIADSGDVLILLEYSDRIPLPDWWLPGDVDCSGTVDIDDIVYLIIYIFAGGPPPGDPNGDGILGD